MSAVAVTAWTVAGEWSMVTISRRSLQLPGGGPGLTLARGAGFLFQQPLPGWAGSYIASAGVFPLGPTGREFQQVTGRARAQPRETGGGSLVFAALSGNRSRPRLAPPATVSPSAASPVQDRLIRILGATAYGLHPEDGCGACPAGGRCAECEQDLADVDALNAGISAVQDAPADIAAVAAYGACLLSLAGITSGGDAGTQDMTIPGVGK